MILVFESHQYNTQNSGVEVSLYNKCQIYKSIQIYIRTYAAVTSDIKLRPVSTNTTTYSGKLIKIFLNIFLYLEYYEIRNVIK